MHVHACVHVRVCACACMVHVFVYPLRYLKLFTQNKTGKISFTALQFYYVTLAIHIVNRYGLSNKVCFCKKINIM